MFGREHSGKVLKIIYQEVLFLRNHLKMNITTNHLNGPSSHLLDNGLSLSPLYLRSGDDTDLFIG